MNNVKYAFYIIIFLAIVTATVIVDRYFFYPKTIITDQPPVSLDDTDIAVLRDSLRELRQEMGAKPLIIWRKVNVPGPAIPGEKVPYEVVKEVPVYVYPLGGFGSEHHFPMTAKAEKDSMTLTVNTIHGGYVYKEANTENLYVEDSLKVQLTDIVMYKASVPIPIIKKKPISAIVGVNPLFTYKKDKDKGFRLDDFQADAGIRLFDKFDVLGTASTAGKYGIKLGIKL